MNKMITLFTQHFGRKMQVILIDVTYCEKKKKTSKSFLKKLQELINDLCEIKIK